jgi:hypothetical protein
MQDSQTRQDNVGQVLNIDINRVLYRAFRFWYLVLACLLVALTIAYFKNRYAVKIFPVTASIIIKESEETSEGRLLYNNPLVKPYRNYLNELYLIRSYPMIEETLADLNFGVSFNLQGNVLTTESYDFPCKVKVIETGGMLSHSYLFEPLNNREFRLSTRGENAEQKTFLFNDTITFRGLKAIFTYSGAALNYDSTVPIVFEYRHPSLIAGSYISRLKAAWAEEGAGVINLSIDGTNPAKEIDFLNGLIHKYQVYDLEKKNGTASRTIEFINSQLVNITDSLRGVERNLERFKDDNVRTSLSEDGMRLYTKLEVLETQKVELSLRANYLTTS